MRKRTSQKFIAYFTYEVFVSEAYRNLKPAAKEILMLLYFEIKTSSQKKRAAKYTPAIVNRNEIRLPYKDAENILGYSKGTIWKAFSQLLAHGFIKVIHYGGGAKGDSSIYGITEDWRKWKTGMTIRKLKKKGQVGWQTKKAS